MKFDEKIQSILNEKSDDLGPKDIKNIKSSKVAFITYDSGRFKGEVYVTVEELNEMLKDYKWDGKVWVNKKDSNKYANISTSLP